VKFWLVALLLVLSGFAQAETWRFGLIGDVPYSDDERLELPHMLQAINDKHVDFFAHIGDFKHGKDRCDNSLFEDRYQLFNASQSAFIFVPGDNEWTDCERMSNGAYAPLERLNKLRNLFWKDGFSLGKNKLSLERQPGVYREHSRFRLGPVLFVTLNLPGGNNNFGITQVSSAEFKARNPVVLAWLKESFALARRERLAGIVLLFHANPGFKHFAQGLAHQGYRDFLESLQAETLNFSGQVVAVHGDSHSSRIDHPLRDAQGKKMPNFTRVETFGYPMMGWTRGIIDTNSPALFSFETYPWPAKAQ
jgi:hypothetical protein